MSDRLDVLEKHIAALEAAVFTQPVVIPEPAFKPEDKIDQALIDMATKRGLVGFCGARRVPKDYYDRDFEYRRGCIDAQTIDQLCKCVLFEVKDTPDPLKRFVCVVIQYVDKISQPRLLDITARVVGRRVTDVSMAKEEDATKLSGSEHNAMTPVLMRPSKDFEKYQVPVILSERIAALNPPFFWLGGGEVDVKFGIDTRKFVEVFKPVIANISE